MVNPLNQLIAQNLGNWRLQEEERKRNEPDPLGVLLGGIAGFLTGGPVGAGLGALQGLGAQRGQGAAGLAQAGIGGYQAGLQGGNEELKKKYRQMLAAPKNQAEWVQGAMGLYPEEVIKGVFSKPLVNMGEGGDVQTKSMLDALFAPPAAPATTGATEIKSIIEQAKSSGLSSDDILALLLK